MKNLLLIKINKLIKNIKNESVLIKTETFKIIKGFGNEKDIYSKNPTSKRRYYSI